jgi:hypothetical protein
MREKRKDGMLSHGFLLDRDVSKVASLSPKKRTKTLANVGLPEDASDPEIVKKAWARGTIVTGNGDDFVREINRFLAQTKKAECHEMFGLVVLPIGYERSQDKTNLRLGKERLTWTDVAHRNYNVRVKRNGATEVQRFPRCAYCLKNEKKN